MKKLNAEQNLQLSYLFNRIVNQIEEAEKLGHIPRGLTFRLAPEGCEATMGYEIVDEKTVEFEQPVMVWNNYPEIYSEKIPEEKIERETLDVVKNLIFPGLDAEKLRNLKFSIERRLEDIER